VQGWINRRQAGVAVALLALALALPGANFQLFDGLPFDSLGEAIAAVVLLPLALSRSLRARLVELSGTLHPRTFQLASVAALVVIGLKVVLLASGVEEGFRGCYGSPAAPLPSGPCERSYTNLLDRYGGATRIDDTIAFGGLGGAPSTGLTGSSWNLPFIDDLRYDLPVTPKDPTPRERPPLRVRWTGTLSAAPGADIIVTYIGEGEIRAGGALRALPPAYSAPRQVIVPAVGGERAFALTYSFTPRNATGPYAAIRVAYGRGDQVLDGGALVRAAPPAAAWRVFAFVADTLLVVLFALIAIGQGLSLVRRDRVILLAVAAAGWLVLAGWTPWREAVFLALLGVALVLARPQNPLLVGWYAVIFVCALHPLVSAASVGAVSYRTTGNDWLTFESQARSMLYGSWMGAEEIFSYRPGWRYILFAERSILGDGDVLRSVFAYATVSLPLIALGTLSARLRSDRRALIAALVGIGLLVLNSPQLRVYLNASASESVTLAVIPLLFIVPVIRPPQPWPWVLAPIGAALTLTINPDHVIAIVLLIAVYALLVPIPLRRWLVLGVLLGVLVGMLPSIHDSIYGHRLGIAFTSISKGGSVSIPSSDLVEVFTDSKVRSELVDHAEQLLYLSSPPGQYDSTLAVFMLALLACWLVVLFRTVRRWRSVPKSHLLLLLVPAAYLAPHLIYEVSTYYPRHLVAGYLAMAAVLITAIATWRPPVANERPPS
jgi:hypothetical protein